MRSLNPHASLAQRCAALLCGVLITACTTAPSQRSSPGPTPPATPYPAGTPPYSAPGSTAPPSATAPSAPITAPFIERPSPGAAALSEGVAAFHKGEYGRADSKIKQSFLQGLSNTPDLVRGYKTIAFVNCITQRIPQCEKSFEAAIAVDRKFDLSPSERKHPAWGPVFTKVRQRFAAY